VYSERARAIARVLLDGGRAAESALGDLQILFRTDLVRRLQDEQRLWHEARARAEERAADLERENAALRARLEREDARLSAGRAD
jgi:hypothetical protein